MMMAPSFSSGANTALLVPMTTPALPSFIRRHSSRRSPAERLLCSTAMSSPKCEEKVLSI